MESEKNIKIGNRLVVTGALGLGVGGWAKWVKMVKKYKLPDIR